MPFSTLGLSDHIVQGVRASGYTTPTQIQSLAIPRILERRDVIGCAQTGTGKTAAFVLPLLQNLSADKRTRGRTTIRVLVLAPTRELALQIDEAVGAYGKFTSVKSMPVFGGVNMENQVKRLKRGVDIVVATPGRLLDHIARRTIDLSRVEYLVLDEADRMFDMGFIHDIKKIIALVPRKRQTLMFSATMSKQIRDLVRSVQQDAEEIEVGERRKPVESVSQRFYSVDHGSKMALLVHMLGTKGFDSVLVFSRTKHNADRITRRLGKSGFAAVAIHSNRTQTQRQRALAGFKQGTYKILVATDIAARGIDVEGISHVINFDTPVFAEDYIHRIGRTGRASEAGDAITFVSERERDAFRRIEKFIGRKEDIRTVPGFTKNNPPISGMKLTSRSGKDPRKRSTPRVQSESKDGRKEHRLSKVRKRPAITRSPSPEAKGGEGFTKDDWKALMREDEQRPIRSKNSKPSDR